MTSRRRNLAVILLVLAVLGGALAVIFTKPTRLGLDLRGGIELVYEAQPTPKVPEVTPQAITDAIQTIRKRTDALGVSEPEIQQAGADQIAIGLPDVANAERAIQQVGTTAQLQFYDWEPNVFPNRDTGGPNAVANPDRPYPSLLEAVERASNVKPRAEATDIPAGGPDPEVARRLGGDQRRIEQFYDRRNDTAGQKLYLFGRGDGLIEGPAGSCEELLSDFEPRPARGGRAPAIPSGSECGAELRALGPGGPPPGSRVLKVPQGIVVVKAERPRGLREGAPFEQYYVLEDDSELSGNEIRDPLSQTDQRTSEPVVAFQFTDEGQQAFSTVTGRIAQRGSEIVLPPGTPRNAAFQRFAITLDNQVVSLATIDFIENPEGIDGRTGAQISGIGDIQATQDLAEQLRIGALPIELKLISQTQVSATLGQQALDQGLLAAGAGLALTLLFLLGFYRVLGAVAGTTLLVYAAILYAIVKLIPITLTLPGIAGLILTLGVAADANIVIFERIKEEVRAGRSIPGSITAGYGKALRTIVDANVVTVGVAFILFMLATGGVKGFALTLGIGTLVSLFTAVLATSAILGSMSRTRLLGSRFALGAGERGPRRFDFMGSSKWFFSGSGLILVAGAVAIAGLGINLGIDFESGTRLQTPLERPATVQQVRDALAPVGLGDSKIQQVQDPELGQNIVQISTPTLRPDEVTDVQQRLDQAFGVRQADFTSSSIGPTFGAQVARTALYAIIASLILISFYIAFRFEAKYAVPVLIALTHDLLITAGVYALTEREVTTSTVAAMLTILGYSLYDTIIVFDRIRENVPRMPRATFSQIVNRSMSEVITRSLVTSFSTLLPITALMLFGGETLRDFGFALLVGVASGTYSSIFIASPVLTAWKEREGIYVRRRRLALADNGGTIPAFADIDLGSSSEEDGERRGPRGGGRGPRSAGAPGAATRPAGSARAQARPDVGDEDGTAADRGDGAPADRGAAPREEGEPRYASSGRARGRSAGSGNPRAESGAPRSSRRSNGASTARTERSGDDGTERDRQGEQPAGDGKRASQRRKKRHGRRR